MTAPRPSLGRIMYCLTVLVICPICVLLYVCFLCFMHCCHHGFVLNYIEYENIILPVNTKENVTIIP